jgi:hypothetical protein
MIKRDVGYLREKGRLAIRATNLLLPDTARVVGKAQDAFSLRPMMEEIKQSNRWNCVGAEIGVDQGRHASRILENLTIKMLYLIDPYEYRPSHKKDACFLIDKHKNIKWVEKYSDKAMDDVPNNLDFIYIDGDHSYNVVYQDCENWYPKITMGGVIGGHDYISSRPDVKRAVIDFCRTYKLRYHTKPNDWWIIKEKEI